MQKNRYEHILYEVERGRARITLNQPKRRNALSVALLEELADALWEADDDRAVHCDTVSGADTAKIGFALESVPAEQLEAEVEGLADRFSHVDTAPAARQMFSDIGTKGIKQAVADRDAPFGDGRTRVDEPEPRGDKG
jgi:enoyl-CoA hydratase/carnithine racemase